SKAHAVSVSTMTSMVDRLIQNALLERQSDDRDRRIVRVSLAAEGKKVVRYLMKVRRQELEKFLCEMQDSDIDQFVQSIENVAGFLAKAKQSRP
ncbi:MarR family transcriptional regulator, partial [Thermodesulfobacteriota bacterium]